MVVTERIETVMDQVVLADATVAFDVPAVVLICDPRPAFGDGNAFTPARYGEWSGTLEIPFLDPNAMAIAGWFGEGWMVSGISRFAFAVVAARPNVHPGKRTTVTVEFQGIAKPPGR